jgi:hypothetical protein
MLRQEILVQAVVLAAVALLLMGLVVFLAEAYMVAVQAEVKMLV